VRAGGLQADLVAAGAVPILAAIALSERDLLESRAVALHALGNIALDCASP
jgi:hypothetical protein